MTRLVATRKGHQNKALVDPWTVVHFSAGLAAGLVRLDPRMSLSAAVAWEVIEQAFERQPMGQEAFKTAGPETVSNAVMDILVFAAGQALGELWNRTDAAEQD